MEQVVANCYDSAVAHKEYVIMAKASSPIRLDQSLMDSASSVAKAAHRSAAEQIEFWADIGRTLTQMIDVHTLVSLKAGTSRLLIEPVQAEAVDPDALFAQLDAERVSGSLSQSVTGCAVRYQASATHPGWLEQIRADGSRVVGRFEGGVFQACDDPS